MIPFHISDKRKGALRSLEYRQKPVRLALQEAWDGYKGTLYDFTQEHIDLITSDNNSTSAFILDVLRNRMEYNIRPLSFDEAEKRGYRVMTDAVRMHDVFEACARARIRPEPGLKGFLWPLEGKMLMQQLLDSAQAVHQNPDDQLARDEYAVWLDRFKAVAGIDPNYRLDENINPKRSLARSLTLTSLLPHADDKPAMILNMGGPCTLDFGDALDLKHAFSVYRLPTKPGPVEAGELPAGTLAILMPGTVHAGQTPISPKEFARVVYRAFLVETGHLLGRIIEADELPLRHHNPFANESISQPR